ncbi:MAG: RNA polymerase sigma factor [Chitinophagales bacterium]
MQRKPPLRKPEGPHQKNNCNSISSQINNNRLIDHLFRHESGKMVSVLTKIFGLTNIEIAEDIVQDTLLKAMEQWKLNGVPENPSGWLMTVAKNKTLDLLRHKKLEKKYAEKITPLLQSEYTLGYTLNSYFSDDEIKDDQLRMMFVCCHPEINEESSIALILKNLCGFSIGEIARGFLSNEANINKRLYRAKEKFRTEEIKFEIPTSTEINKRINSVLKALYLLFNEAYSSTSVDNLIREDLAAESLRLCLLLTQHPTGNIPSVHALLALMYFHGARFRSRIDAAGNILLLNKQDRLLWDEDMIKEGIHELNLASTGNELSAFHIEACIAYEHCSAGSYDETNWKNILGYYDLLYTFSPSPVIALNRAIIIAEISGPDDALLEISKIKESSAMKNYYLLPATIADLLLRKNEKGEARKYFEEAMALTNSPAEKKFLATRIHDCR